MDIKKREETYKELDNLLVEIQKSNKQQRDVLNTLFLEKFENLYKEFDIWQEEEIKKIDKKVEEGLEMENKIEKFLEWEQMSRDTIDVKRIYVDIAGDLVTGILLSQIIYYFLPNRNGESKLRIIYEGKEWLAKRREDWWEECRITPKQFDRSIKILEEKGIVETKIMKFKGNPTKHIHLNIETLLNEIEKMFNKNSQNILNSETDLVDTDETEEEQENSFLPKGKKLEESKVLEDSNLEFEETIPATIDNTGFSPKVKNEIPQKGKNVFALWGRTITKNYTAESENNNLQEITAGVTLSRESKPSRESIYLCSKKVNNKLAKLIKINNFKLFLIYNFLENNITIKPCKYKILRYRDDNVYSKIKNNKNLSLETYTNSKDLRSISKLHPNRDIVTCSSNKNISSGRDNISHVRELTDRKDPNINIDWDSNNKKLTHVQDNIFHVKDYSNRKDTEPVKDSYRESNIYALTRINAEINNLNLGTSEKVSECSSLQKTRNDITTAQQAEKEPDSWEKVKSDEEIRYSYGDWDDYSIEKFDDGIIHTSPRAPHEIFVDPAAACSDNKAGSSEKTVSAQSKINCPAVRVQQILETAEEQSSKAQERNLMLNQQRKNLQEVLNAGTAEEVSTGFEITKLKIPGETIKLSNKVFLPNPDENILAPEVSAERVFCGDDSKDERTASSSIKNTAGSRNKNTEPAARTGFEVINWQVSKSVKAVIGTVVHGSKIRHLTSLPDRWSEVLQGILNTTPDAVRSGKSTVSHFAVVKHRVSGMKIAGAEAAKHKTVDKHVFPRDGPL
ncbi:hypothetical protein [Thermoanaerobacter sp. YS13]|uniref:hypothetical protein n=1 Tax=Thermoanaerobacter sp. YS13 TaxID=1511746 RepID=UPI00068BF6AE|nr:hypothetical protein [Thermoanaerobacter sp. YS13]